MGQLCVGRARRLVARKLGGVRCCGQPLPGPGSGEAARNHQRVRQVLSPRPLDDAAQGLRSWRRWPLGAPRRDRLRVVKSVGPHSARTVLCQPPRERSPAPGAVRLSSLLLRPAEPCEVQGHPHGTQSIPVRPRTCFREDAHQRPSAHCPAAAEQLSHSQGRRLDQAREELHQPPLSQVQHRRRDMRVEVPVLPHLEVEPVLEVHEPAQPEAIVCLGSHEGQFALRPCEARHRLNVCKSDPLGPAITPPPPQHCDLARCRAPPGHPGQAHCFVQKVVPPPFGRPAAPRGRDPSQSGSLPSDDHQCPAPVPHSPQGSSQSRLVRPGAEENVGYDQARACSLQRPRRPWKPRLASGRALATAPRVWAGAWRRSAPLGPATASAAPRGAAAPAPAAAAGVASASAAPAPAAGVASASAAAAAAAPAAGRRKATPVPAPPRGRWPRRSAVAAAATLSASATASRP